MDKTALMRQIGANLQKIRLDKQLSQENLATMVDRDNSTITRLETGKRMMSLVSLVEMA